MATEGDFGWEPEAWGLPGRGLAPREARAGQSLASVLNELPSAATLRYRGPGVLPWGSPEEEEEGGGRSSQALPGAAQMETQDPRPSRELPWPMQARRVHRNNQARAQGAYSSGSRVGHWARLLARGKDKTKEGLRSLQPWAWTVKRIGGQFGAGTESYFSLLRFLLLLNVLASVLAACMVLLPTWLEGAPPGPPGPSASSPCGSYSPHSPGLATFPSQLFNLLSGQGYLEWSPLFYGFYPARRHLAVTYLCSVFASGLICLLLILQRSVSGLKQTLLAEVGALTSYSHRVFSAWTFGLCGALHVQLRQRRILYELQDREYCVDPMDGPEGCGEAPASRVWGVSPCDDSAASGGTGGSRGPAQGRGADAGPAGQGVAGAGAAQPAGAGTAVRGLLRRLLGHGGSRAAAGGGPRPAEAAAAASGELPPVHLHLRGQRRAAAAVQANRLAGGLHSEPPDRPYLIQDRVSAPRLPARPALLSLVSDHLQGRRPGRGVPRLWLQLQRAAVLGDSGGPGDVQTPALRSADQPGHCAPGPVSPQDTLWPLSRGAGALGRGAGVRGRRRGAGAHLRADGGVGGKLFLPFTAPAQHGQVPAAFLSEEAHSVFHLLPGCPHLPGLHGELLLPPGPSSWAGPLCRPRALQHLPESIWAQIPESIETLPQTAQNFLFFLGTQAFAVPLLLISSILMAYTVALANSHGRLISELKRQIETEARNKVFLARAVALGSESGVR